MSCIFASLILGTLQLDSTQPVHNSGVGFCHQFLLNCLWFHYG
jgi:hypothetical protein